MEKVLIVFQSRLISLGLITSNLRRSSPIHFAFASTYLLFSSKPAAAALTFASSSFTATAAL